MTQPSLERRTSNRADESEEGTSLLPSMIPNPSHPRVKPRILATSIIILFFTVLIYEAILAPTSIEEENEKGIAWSRYEHVEWGTSSRQDLKSTDETGAGREPEEKEQVDTAVPDRLDPSSTTSNKTIVLGTITTFDSKKVESVEEDRRSGKLSNWVWHQSLNDWNKSAVVPPYRLRMNTRATSGRLIIVGDLHGTHQSLQSLLASLTYSSQSDTLLHVGDLVSKAPLASSLATVDYMRRHGVRGVRGNHDQGVLEWRAWMMSYGRLTRSLSDSKLSDTNVAESEDEKQLGGELDIPEGRNALKGHDDQRSMKRGWFGSLFGGNSDSQKDQSGLADGGEAVREEIGQEEGPTSTEAQPEPMIGGTVNATRGDTSSTLKTGEEDGLISPTSEGEVDLHSSNLKSPVRPSKQSTTSNGMIGSSSRVNAPPTIPNQSNDASSISSSSSGALLDEGYEWLSLSKAEAEGLGVVIPRGWEWGGAWFEIARHLPQADYEYLTKLPLTLHLESLDTYLVHAGMVPSESPASVLETYAFNTTSSWLQSSSLDSFTPSSTSLQSSVPPLFLIPQNTDPWTLINLRTLNTPKKSKKKFKVSKSSKKGTPWSQIWSETMSKCSDGSPDSNCEPVSIIYGHWAGRGLDVREYSIGLDSGCVYGRSLSALVIEFLPPSTGSEGKNGKYRVLDNGFDSGVKTSSGRGEQTRMIKLQRKAWPWNKAPVPAEDEEEDSGQTNVTGEVEGATSTDKDRTEDAETAPTKAEVTEITEDAEGVLKLGVTDTQSEGVETQSQDVVFFGGRAAKVVSVSCKAEVGAF